MSHFLIVIFSLSLATATLAADALSPRVLPAEKLDKYWLIANSTTLDANVPNSGLGLTTPTCAAVSFLIEKNGSTSHIKVQRIVPEGDLKKVALSLAANLRFKPTELNLGRDPVFSYLIFPFNLPTDPKAREPFLTPCMLEQLRWEER